MGMQATISASVFVREDECIKVDTTSSKDWPMVLCVNSDSGDLRLYLTRAQAERIADLLTDAMNDMDSKKICDHCGQSKHF